MRVGLVGLGLVGGSLALALRATHDVVAYDSDAGVRSSARSAGLAVVDALAAVIPADVVVVATPFSAIVPTLRDLAPRAGATVLLDVGSLKRPIAAYAETAPAEARIVGGHPMAGTTGAGFASADPTLFRGRPFLLVSTARSNQQSMDVASALARAVGAEPTVCSAEAHDRAIATLSGVPLAVALALSRSGEDVARLAGPGFRDATRLAATPRDLADVLLRGNRDEMKAALRRFRDALDEVERGLG